MQKHDADIKSLPLHYVSFIEQGHRTENLKCRNTHPTVFQVFLSRKRIVSFRLFFRCWPADGQSRCSESSTRSKHMCNSRTMNCGNVPIFVFLHFNFRLAFFSHFMSKNAVPQIKCESKDKMRKHQKVCGNDLGRIKHYYSRVVKLAIGEHRDWFVLFEGLINHSRAS